jgi:hypothetical protein
MPRILLPVLAFFLVLSSAAPAPAEDAYYVIPSRATPGTCITKLPCTITTPGYYYLNRNLTASSGSGITINVDNVVIDLMGFVLSGPPVGFVDGITITGNNVEVRNGTVRNWYQGISATGSRCRAINVRAVENFTGISLLGSGAMIQGCTASPRVSGIGGGLVVTSGEISGCTVMDFSPSNNTAPMIYLSSGGRVSDNLVLHCTGIGIKAVGSATVKGNVVLDCIQGIDMQWGGSLVGNTIVANSGQTALIFDNLPNTTRRVVGDQNSCWLDPGAAYYSGEFPVAWGLNARSIRPH